MSEGDDAASDGLEAHAVSEEPFDKDTPEVDLSHRLFATGRKFESIIRGLRLDVRNCKEIIHEREREIKSLKNGYKEQETSSVEVEDVEEEIHTWCPS